MEKLHRVPTFIGLKMAYHVPRETRGAERNLGFCFLHLVFAENLQPQCRRRFYRFGWLTFAHREEQDLRRLSTDSSAGGFDPGAELLVILTQFHAPSLTFWRWVT